MTHKNAGERNGNFKHGLTKSPTYASWIHMKRRCLDPSHHNYPRYGARGIKIANRWLSSFENFLEDMGKRPKGKSLDRINNNDDYKPGNCRWATWKEQARNRRNTIFVEFKGKKEKAIELALKHGLEPNTFICRINYGWSVEEALKRKTRDRGRKITYDGNTASIRKWSQILGISYTTMANRISYHGYEGAVALGTNKNTKEAK